MQHTHIVFLILHIYIFPYTDVVGLYCYLLVSRTVTMLNQVVMEEMDTDSI